MTSNIKYGTIRDMRRLIRKWWLLRELRKDCKGHNILLSVEALLHNIKHSVSRPDLLSYIGKKSIERFSWILLWRKKENQLKLKKRIDEYNSIYDESINEGLIHVEAPNTLQENGQILNPPQRPFFRTTDRGDKYISQFWYRAIFGNAYAKAIITALVIAIAGFYLKQILKDNNAPPVVNVYPNITTPTPILNPTINVYPNAQTNR